MMGAYCKSCGAAIRWAKTLAGKAMPLDAKSEKRVVITYDPDGPYGPGEEHCDVVDTYTSHFATCPNADQQRKR